MLKFKSHIDEGIKRERDIVQIKRHIQNKERDQKTQRYIED